MKLLLELKAKLSGNQTNLSCYAYIHIRIEFKLKISKKLIMLTRKKFFLVTF